MKLIRTFLLTGLTISLFQVAVAQDFEVNSPDGKIKLLISNGEKLTWSVTFGDRMIVNPSETGFQFKNEPPMAGNFEITDSKKETIRETWIPVVRSKHAEVLNHCAQLHLFLREKGEQKRQMEMTFRAYNDGIAFQYKLFRAAKVGDRQITRELTTLEYLILTGYDINGDPIYVADTAVLFDSDFYQYFWDYDNNGLRLVQLRFYPK